MNYLKLGRYTGRGFVVICYISESGEKFNTAHKLRTDKGRKYTVAHTNSSVGIRIAQKFISENNLDLYLLPGDFKRGV